jgi:hypothetical protein
MGDPSGKEITVAFSSHRPETLPYAFDTMRRHQTIILEEPKNPMFMDMLRDRLSIEDYLLGTDFEFPLFAKRSCHILRDLYRQGKKILQVDPYMEVLGHIHDFFGQGGTPQGLERGSPRRRVYDAEHRWTAALLAYFQKTPTGTFDEVIGAVKAFARADAARGRLRDRLRAEGLALAVRPHDSVYIEAGKLHVPLMHELRKRTPRSYVIKPVYLMGPVIQKITGRSETYGPGDLLTLLYTFHPGYTGKRADLLAARSLVCIKILQKEEIEEGTDPFPHTRNEIESNRLVRDLSYDTCSRLYGQIRSKKTPEARGILREYAAGGRERGKHRSP